MKISASIIVYNEAHNIDELCRTIDWVDEIVIVDSDSSDQTAEIARRYTDKVFNRPFRGYKDKHEFADSQTTGDWILWVDADERVTPELRRSIENLRLEPEESLSSGYWIARKTFHLDRWISHSGWYPDYQMRFYRKADSFWGGVAPHETARVKGETAKLKGEFLHYPQRDLSKHHQTIDSYTTLAARYWAERGRSISRFNLFFLTVSGFVRSYIMKQGFRDGMPGLILAIFAAYSVFLKYAKVWELQQNKK